MVTVKVKVFGPLKDILSSDELSVNVPPPHTGEAAFNVLAEAHPKLREWKPSLRLAVNFEYASLDRTLHTGDEICFIPPVSGG
jgi:molybdopterin synthase sulfur carrier subunit